MLEKLKLAFDIGSITTKANIELSEKENRKITQEIFTIIIVWTVTQKYKNEFLLFLSNATHKQLKERETFWQHWLKTFYPLGLNEKKECVYYHTPDMIVRQSIMREFWLSFNFINFFIINLFKFVYVRTYLVVLHLRYYHRHFYSDSIFVYLPVICYYYYLYS